MMLPDRPLVLLRQVFPCFAKARTLCGQWMSMDVNGTRKAQELKH